jgi:hypothetical protein
MILGYVIEAIIKVKSNKIIFNILLKIFSDIFSNALGLNFIQGFDIRHIKVKIYFKAIDKLFF